jgi:methyltransferase family protein
MAIPTFYRTRRFLRRLVLDPYYWRISSGEFSRALSQVKSVSDAIDLAWRFKGGGFYETLKPNQDRSEITALANRVQSIFPKVIVEIGTRAGGTLFFWSQCSKSLELLVSIDLPAGIHGGGYPKQRGRFYRLFTQNLPNCRLELLRLDSQQESTRARVLELLAGRPIDFLFIDGDHRYAGVKKDYELYSELVRPNGLIAFHDIRPNPEVETVEVWQLWDHLKEVEAQTEEIVDEPYRGHFGIGLVTKNGDLDRPSRNQPPNQSQLA